MFTRLLINWPYRLLALLIAIALKWEVSETNHPHGDKRINVPVAINGIPSNLVVTDATPDVTLLISGSGSELDGISSTSYRANINLAGFRAGPNQTARIDITPVPGVPEDVSVDSVSPQLASVSLDTSVKVKYHIGVTFDRVAPNGLSYGSPTVNPPIGVVQGPQLAVNRIVKLVVDGSDAVNGETIAPGMLDGFAPVIAVDAQQNPVTGVTILPQQADVRVPVVRQVGIKQVLVNAVFTGHPMYPYQVSDVEVEPSAITIQGSPDELGSYSVIKTQPIDLSNAEADIKRDVPIYSPPGVTSASPSTVSVTVHISKSEAGDRVDHSLGSQGGVVKR